MFFKTSNNYYKNKRAGRPLKLTTKNERRVFREASKGKMCARELNTFLNLPV